ncbi:hypothetical protein O0I10_001042 [Lichtheimia ornata]|uniref:Uncharacterized protein n=1 Tax=Lichtheimia ornata TaxID=688661 RepID=A0AAD8DHN4_9FUNG|nr:hypothetical protein O0I10_001042 [Lichtheimia ornata]
MLVGTIHLLWSCIELSRCDARIL